MINLLKFILLSTSCLVSLNALADRGLPYSQTGNVDVISIDENRIVLSDRQYNISPSVVLNSRGGKKIGINNITTGMTLGYNADDDSGVAISEVWVLTGDAIDLSINDD